MPHGQVERGCQSPVDCHHDEDVRDVIHCQTAVRLSGNPKKPWGRKTRKRIKTQNAMASCHSVESFQTPRCCAIPSKRPPSRAPGMRSEERRVGKESRAQWAP